MTEAANAFLEALAAEGPATDRAGNMGLYAWLIGSWDLDVTRYLDDGTVRRRPGEWHFGWVLEGRAIQDVWIVPPRGVDTGGVPRTYGTTLRTYQPALDAWQVQWIDPVNQSFLTMTGRKEGPDIVQLGDGTAGRRIRWSFRDITPNSFLWRGEVSSDGGETWLKQVEFHARRRAAS